MYLSHHFEIFPTFPHDSNPFFWNGDDDTPQPNKKNNSKNKSQKVKNNKSESV